MCSRAAVADTIIPNVHVQYPGDFGCESLRTHIYEALLSCLDLLNRETSSAYPRGGFTTRALPNTRKQSCWSYSLCPSFSSPGESTIGSLELSMFSLVWLFHICAAHSGPDGSSTCSSEDRIQVDGLSSSFCLRFSIKESIIAWNNALAWLRFELDEQSPPNRDPRLAQTLDSAKNVPWTLKYWRQKKQRSSLKKACPVGKKAWKDPINGSTRKIYPQPKDSTICKNSNQM
jgi:hypothetical protein